MKELTGSLDCPESEDFALMSLESLIIYNMEFLHLAARVACPSRNGRNILCFYCSYLLYKIIYMIICFIYDFILAVYSLKTLLHFGAQPQWRDKDKEQFLFGDYLKFHLNRYRRKRPKVDASIFDSTLSHTRRWDASKKNTCVDFWPNSPVDKFRVLACIG